jgi:hypothetical protein
MRPAPQAAIFKQVNMIWLDQVSMIWLDKEEKASAAALSLPSGHNPGATMLRYGANDPNRP